VSVIDTGSRPDRSASDLRHAQPFLRIEGLRKAYGPVTAVDGVDLEVGRGELFSILGGSGCGKSTWLRMLAGLLRPDAGRVMIDGEDVTDVPPHRRPVNMMFQSYALFPHMTVEQNVAYGLEKERRPRAEIAARVTAVLTLVKLEGERGRRPDQLSGGQQQRAALARALVKEPKVLLLDEPFAALDRKLRVHTRFELVRLQARLGLTFVLVTHDQEEAMAISTRIAVMDGGRVRQVGTPADIYERPASRFVADFIGNVNLFEGIVARRGRTLALRCAATGTEILAPLTSAVGPDGSRLHLGVRPEHVEIGDVPPGAGQPNAFEGTLRQVAYQGDAFLYCVELASGKSVDALAPNRGGAEPPLQAGQRVFLWFAPASAVPLSD
jgi:putrescine transport system ATP-binding protein